jgi:hypothetical protein
MSKFRVSGKYFSTLSNNSARIAVYEVVGRHKDSVTITGGRTFDVVVLSDGTEAFFPMGKKRYASIVRAYNQEKEAVMPGDGEWAKMWLS